MKISKIINFIEEEFKKDKERDLNITKIEIENGSLKIILNVYMFHDYSCFLEEKIMKRFKKQYKLFNFKCCCTENRIIIKWI